MQSATSAELCHASERNWPAVQTELFAIVYALRMCRYHIYGHETVIHTDHKPLIYLLAKRKPNTNLSRWLIELQEYPNIVIEHIEGQRNTLADALSRIEKGTDLYTGYSVIGRSSLNRRSASQLRVELEATGWRANYARGNKQKKRNWNQHCKRKA